MRQLTRPILGAVIAAALVLAGASPALADGGSPAVDQVTGSEASPSGGAGLSDGASPIDRPATQDGEAPAGPTPDPTPTPAPDATPASAPATGPDTSAATLTALAVRPAALPVLAELPPGPESPAPAPEDVDAYARYRPQTTCDPTPKPGAVYLLNLLISYYGQGRSSGISRDCSVGGVSEHKEGRALDWGLSVNVPAEKAAADAFVQWLTAVGPDGKVGYNARRLGVMHVIWNQQIWSNSSSSAAWRPYVGESPHTDHVHVSLSWAGAYERTSWWTGVALPSEAEYEPYVTQVYSDLFNRQPDGGGLRTWTVALADGVPRVAVANAITGSREYRSGLISGVYQEFLDRDPDGPGLESWLLAMDRGATVQGVEAGFIASDEYYAASGGTDAGWVVAMYGDVLGRGAAPSEVDGWVGRIARGASRTQVALGFLLSAERLSAVIDGYYQHLLGRGIDPVGRTTWVTLVQGGARTESIIGGIVASDEYWGRANALQAQG